MVNINLFGNRLSIITGLKSTKKSFVLKNVAYTAEHPTKAQSEAREAFASFMIEKVRGKQAAQGTTRLSDGRVISNSAVQVMIYYNPGSFGGPTPEQRRQLQYDMADLNLKKLKARTAELKGAGAGRSMVRYEEAQYPV